LQGTFKDPLSFHYEILKEKRGWSTSYSLYYRPYIRTKGCYGEVNKIYIDVDFENEGELIEFVKKEYNKLPIREDGTQYKDSNGNEMRIGDTLEVEMWCGKSTGKVVRESNYRKNVGIRIGSKIWTDIHGFLKQNKCTVIKRHAVGEK